MSMLLSTLAFGVISWVITLDFCMQSILKIAILGFISILMVIHLLIVPRPAFRYYFLFNLMGGVWAPLYISFIMSESKFACSLEGFGAWIWGVSITALVCLVFVSVYRFVKYPLTNTKE